MAVRKVLAGFAVLALGAGLGLIAQRASALPACSHTTCRDEVEFFGPISGRDRALCFKFVIAACKAGDCTCTDEAGLRSCGYICSPSGAFLD